MIFKSATRYLPKFLYDDFSLKNNFCVFKYFIKFNSDYESDIENWYFVEKNAQIKIKQIWK
jgi:hypothetical protein